MADEQLSIFISYSRADSEFVDRLDADLRARGFRTWVDRRRLEGGVDWEREINAAIASCNLFLISLSPPAVNSPYVRQEFEEAHRLGKRMLPALYQNCTIPAWLAVADNIQRQDFTNTDAYALNLKRLLYAIQDPTLDLSAGNDALYNRALKMRLADPERAAIILQHIIDRAPTYFGGQAQRDLADLEARLYAARVARLRTQAEQARREGQYGVEAASLEALLALGDRDPAAYAWAGEYLPIAQQNRDLLGPYGVIQQRVADNDIEIARTLLQSLWTQAPYFRDPANLAHALGLTVPPTYEETRAVASEAARREADRARRAMGEADERGRFERACALMRGDLINMNIDGARAELRRLGYDLDDPAARQFLTQIHTAWRRNLALLGDARREADWGAGKRASQRIEQIKRDADAARAEAEAAYQQWRQLAERVLQQRIDAINRGEAPAS